MKRIQTWAELRRTWTRLRRFAIALAVLCIALTIYNAIVPVALWCRIATVLEAATGVGISILSHRKLKEIAAYEQRDHRV